MTTEHGPAHVSAYGSAGDCPLPPLRSGGRLHIAEGRPWRRALDCVAVGGGEGRRPWHGATDHHDSDLLLVVLSTDPRMVLCLDVAAGDAADSGNIFVRPAETVLFRHGILFDAVKKRSGLSVRMYDSYIGADAHAILDALDKEYHLDIPWFSPARWLDGHGVDF
jgi:hypothetical protein